MITLGIIGVVAAMTLPTLIDNYNKQVVEARLKKFYSAINQAILMAEVDYGDKQFWFEDLVGADLDKDGYAIPGSSPAEKWFNKYFTPYLQTVEEIETLSDGTFCVHFTDGSSLSTLQRATTRDWLYYPGNIHKCLNRYGNSRNARGICAFPFNFVPGLTSPIWRHHFGKGMEPYKYKWDGNIRSLYTDSSYGCGAQGISNTYCTAIIQMNGWKIPKDYPFKVHP